MSNPTFRSRHSIGLITACALMFSGMSTVAEPIRLHPENGHYFLFHDRLAVLVGSSEHYGALINLDFDYIRYLDEMRASGLNVARVFAGTYREIPGSFNITDNTLSPPSGRAIAPWARSAVPGAYDGGNKFDLTKWDAAFFHRMRDFVKVAGERDIVVELTFFSAFYEDAIWNACPMKSTNHINGSGAGGRGNCFLTNSDLLPAQLALVRKCAEELRDCDNIYYEIINEPYSSGVPQAWQNLIINEITTTEAGFPHRHLIAQNVANADATIQNPNPEVSIFNFHYALPNAAKQNFGLNRPLGDDETGYGPDDAQKDFPYRREAWEFMLSGGGIFNHLDYSFTASSESGLATPDAPGGGGPAIRRQLGILRWFLEDLPLLGSSPLTGLVASGVPVGGAVRAMGIPGEAYGLYLRGNSQANLTMNLPAGNYHGQWIDPRSGLSTGLENFTHAGGQRVMASPVYGEDIALRLFVGNSPPPVITLTAPSYNTIVPSDRANLTLTADASVINGTLQSVEFFNGEKSLGLVTEAPYQLGLTDLSKGRHVFSARVVTTDGRQARSPPVCVSVVGPFQTGINLNGNGLEVDGESWLAQSEAIQSGLVLTNATPTGTGQGLIFYPPADPATQVVLSSDLSLSSSEAAAELGISYPVSNGYYDVFLFLLENETSYSRDMRVFLEQEMVAGGIGDQALGEWHKYGPYRTAITDGVLNLALQRESKGTPKIAGFSIYQAFPPPLPADAWLSIACDKDVVVLNYPAGLPSAQVEVSENLMEGGWQPLDLPMAGFFDRNEISVPIEDHPLRFFRLRTD